MKRLIIVLIGCITLVSCSKNVENDASGYGFVDFVFVADETTIVKADNPIFSVDIMNENGVIIKSYSNHNEIAGNSLKLSAGKYIVKAVTGEIHEAAFDKPYYVGFDTIDVVGGKNNQCKVVCSLANVKVGVIVSNEIKDSFKNFKLTVTNSNENGTLVFSKVDGTYSKYGYFKNSGSLEWDLYFESNTGEIFENKDVIKNVKPREFYTLNLTLEADNKPKVEVSISVDKSTNDKQHDVDVSVDKKLRPQITGKDFDIDSEFFIPEKSNIERIVNIVSEEGIKRFKVSHNSLDIFNLGIPYEFDLIKIDEETKGKIESAGLTWQNIKAGSKSGLISIGELLSKLEQNNYNIILDVLDNQQQTTIDTLKAFIGPSTKTTTKPADPWAKHAFLNAIWNTPDKPADIGFEYKKVGNNNSWTKVGAPLDINVSKKSFKAKLENLETETQYVYRAFSGTEYSNEVMFITDAAKQIPNMNFDVWIQGSKSAWFANSTTDSNNSNFWWDSGNLGANTVFVVNPTSPTDEVVVSGPGKKAARLETKDVFAGIIAAGNIYLGKFGKVIKTSGAEIDFGQPYSCRPLSLKGYYSYSPQTIGSANNPYTNLKGTTDYCSIYVILTKWNSRFKVNTSNKTFIDIKGDPDIIAYGELNSNKNTNGYIPFDIKLEYRNMVDKPTYCVIVAASSKYGDYFTGGVGSVLLIDEFEFVF